MWFDIFTFEQTHIAKGRSLKKKTDLSLPVCAVSWSEVSFLLFNHFWVNHRGIMKTYHPKHVFKCDWFSSLISWFLEKKFIESKWKFSIQKYTQILDQYIIIFYNTHTHTQYRHTHHIWEKLSKYKQALIGIFNHIDTHLWTHLNTHQAASLTVKLN